MKRSRVNLNDVAGWDNLLTAAWRAAAGKRQRPAVRSYLKNLDRNLRELREGILEEDIAVGRARRFHIRDPKPRVIHAPEFGERVLHHALMAQVAPVLERALVADTYACLPGRGTRAAVRRVREHAQRFPWHAKMDVRKYFASIRHDLLLTALERKFKDPGLLRLLERIVRAGGESPGRGLPIGALTSQNFANFFLGPLDRFLLAAAPVRGTVRYMDDFVFWGEDGRALAGIERQVVEFLHDRLALTPRGPAAINRADRGITFCGYRIFPGTVRLANSRKRRCLHHWRKWEGAWCRGEVDSIALQRGMDSVLGMTADGECREWRKAVMAGRDSDWHEDV